MNPIVVLDHEGKRLFGFDAELFLKMEAKRDRVWERSILVWVQDVIEETLNDIEDIYASLKTGVELCKLINKLKPGTIPKFATKRLQPLSERANIDEFLKAIWKFGIPSSDMFSTSDLHSRKGLTAVFQCLYSLQKVAISRLGWTGATIDPPSASKVSLSDLDRVPAKKWKSVETSPKSVFCDDLAEGKDKLLLDLQLQVSELTKDLQKSNSERSAHYEEVQELRRSKAQLQTQVREMKTCSSPPDKITSKSSMSGDQLAELVELRRKFNKSQTEILELQKSTSSVSSKAPSVAPQTPLPQNAELQSEVARLQKALAAEQARTKEQAAEIQKLQSQQFQNSGKSKSVPIPVVAQPRSSDGKGEERSTTSAALPPRSGHLRAPTHFDLGAVGDGKHTARGFYSTMKGEDLAGVFRRISNVFSGSNLALTSEDSQQMRNLLKSEEGRRAFTLCLEQVMNYSYTDLATKKDRASQGMVFTKYGRKGKPHERTVKIDSLRGLVDWGSQNVQLRDVLEIKKGKVTKIFLSNPDAQENCCVSLILKDRTLDLESKSQVERDSFYQTAFSIWDQYVLEREENIHVAPLLLDSDNFMQLVFLISQTLRELEDRGIGNELQTLLSLMKAAERICMHDPENLHSHIFVRGLLGGFFIQKDAQFWEDHFLKSQQGQTDGLEDREEAQEEEEEEAMQPHALVPKVCTFSSAICFVLSRAITKFALKLRSCLDCIKAHQTEFESLPSVR
jgi:hypothetical protein